MQFKPMARKIIGFYSDQNAVAGASTGQLFIEISANQIAFLVKNFVSKMPEALEIFELA